MVEWITAPAALDMAARGERTIVFPTRMNLSLLARAGSIADAIAAAAGRPARVVEPVVELHGDKRFLRLQPRTDMVPHWSRCFSERRAGRPLNSPL